jgi:Uma2 family endonuclease
MGAAKELLSFEAMRAAIAALPEGQHGEVLGPGWWRAMSRPGGAHARAAKRLVRALGAVDSEVHGGWWIDMERELQLADRLYVPDLAGWRVADGDLGFVDENPITRAPDWACEILSRGTQAADRTVKLPTYAAAGVAHVWVVDPVGLAIEVYASVAGLPTLVAHARGGVPARLPPFDLEFDPEALFALK